MDAHAGVLGIDFETASAADLKEVGAWSYSCHDSTRVYVVSFCYATGRDQRTAVERWAPGAPPPARLFDYVRAGGLLLAHNAGFERAIWSNILTPHFGWPAYDIDQWRDSQSAGLAINLPSALDGLCQALGCATQKDAEGAKLMKLMAVAVWDPVIGDWSYPHATPANLKRLAQYCDADVLAMLDAWWRLPPLSVDELRLFLEDQRVNERGVFLDQSFAAKLRRLATQRESELSNEALVASAGVLKNSTASPALKTWLKEHGVKLPTLTRKTKAGVTTSETIGKDAVTALLEDPRIEGPVRRVLTNRVEANKATSLAKLKRVPKMVGSDGRLRNALQFCAAHTGRWASYGVQLHNLPKNNLSDEASDLTALCVDREDLALLKCCEETPMASLSQSLRSIIAAPDGYDLIAADYSSVEACGLAWLADQRDKLEFLHNYFAEIAQFRVGRRSAKPMDLYEFAAQSIGSKSRPLGKVCELALGYGMGDVKFAGTGAKMGVVLSLKEFRDVKRSWRDTNAMIVEFWHDLEDAAKAAILNPGKAYVCGKITAASTPTVLALRLPSGRSLRYWKPEVVEMVKEIEVVDDEGHIVKKEIEGEEIRFWSTVDSGARLAPKTTYGGKLVENVTQAVCRDLLGAALPRAEAAGYPIVMHVHDSAAAQVLEGEGDVEEFSQLMAQRPTWAAGFPVDAAGYRAKRFRG